MVPNPPTAADRAAAPEREYRIDELAREAGTTVRNVRAYQDRGLLPPPRRQGRVGLYSEAHLARLRLIGELLGRGYTLANITELIAGWERGKDLSELLGLETALIGSWSEDRSTVLGADEIAERFGGEVDPWMLRRAVELGVLEEVGDRFRVPNVALVDAAAKLVDAGVPLDAVLEVGRQVAASLDGIAGLFVDLVNRHVFESVGDLKPPPGELRRLADLVTQLRPLAELVCDAQLALAMERRIQVELGAHLARMTEPDVAASQ